MLRSNYTEQEQKELTELYSKCDELNAAIELYKRDNNITGGVSANDCKEVRELIRVNNSIANIEDAVIKRELEYFSTRLDELVSQIRETAEFVMIETADGNPDIEISDRWPRMQYVALLSYFQLLQKTPELHQKALQAVNEVFVNRKELISSKRGQEILNQINEAMNMIENAFSRPENKNALLPVVTIYSKILQGKGTNAIFHVGKKDFTVNSFSGASQAKTNDGVVITMSQYSDNVLTTPARQFLDAMLIDLTSRMPNKKLTEPEIYKYRKIKIKLSEFAKQRGISARAAREQVEAYVPMFKQLGLNFNEERTVIKKKKGKKEPITEKITAHIDTNVLSDLEYYFPDDKPIRNGYIIFGFAPKFVEYLSGAYIAHLPNNLLQIDGKHNPHSYFLGRKLSVYYNIRRLHRNKTANYIRVQSLLNALPDMPTYEQVLKEQYGHVRQYMIEPFTRDMDELVNCGVLNFWHYCNSGGAELTHEQFEILNGNETHGVYEVWSNLLVHFELANYPELDAAIDAEVTEKTELIPIGE